MLGRFCFDVNNESCLLVKHPHHHFLLLLEHVRQLLEDTAQLDDGALDVLHGVGALRQVAVGLVGVQQGLRLLARHPTHRDGHLVGALAQRWKNNSQAILWENTYSLGR